MTNRCHQFVQQTLKYGARYYDPNTSRFTQQDPSGQETNPYTYTADNPTNYVDPTGELSIGSILGGVGSSLIAAGSALTTVATIPLCTTILGCVVPITAAGTSIAAAGAAYAFFTS